MKKNQKLLKTIFFFLVFSCFIIPIKVFGDWKYEIDGTLVCYKGLIPCGVKVYIGDLDDGKCTSEFAYRNGEIVYCQLCHVFVFIQGFLNLLFTRIIPLVGVLMVVIAGAMFLVAHTVSPENPSLIRQGKSILTSVAIGMLIMFASWIFVNTIFNLIKVGEWTGLRGGWATIVECNITTEAP
jgi:hypothetical protein